MKNQRTLDNIRAGALTRADLKIVRENALRKMKDGDPDAHEILQAIDHAVAKDASMIFMGFCPNAEFANRLDVEWKAKGICTFDYDESVIQMKTFRDICPGDLLVLKKIQRFGTSMRLYGHGRVRATGTGEDGRRYLKMDWATQDQVIEVPWMACQSTVNLRSMEAVEAEMPEEFFAWLKQTETATQQE